MKAKLKQECILVRCVPSTSMAASPAMHAPPPTPTKHAPCHAHPSHTCPTHHACPLPCMSPAKHAPAMHSPHHTCPPAMHAPCGQTDTCENITFPQLLLQTVMTSTVQSRVNYRQDVPNNFYSTYMSFIYIS